MLRPTNTEEFLEKLGVDVYPITLIKLLLIKKKLKELTEKVQSEEFEPNNKIDNSDCSHCEEKKKEGITACRQHTSINRVLDNSNTILYDSDSQFFLVKNEIFKFISNKLFIIYCPHTKLIPQYTDKEVRKFKPIVVGYEGNVPQYMTKSIDSSVLVNNNMKCWFNYDFHIITFPKDVQADFGLFCNR